MVYSWNFPPYCLTRVSCKRVCGMVGNILQCEMPRSCVKPGDVDSYVFRDMLPAIYKQIGWTRRENADNEKAGRKNPAKNRKDDFHNGYLWSWMKQGFSPSWITDELNILFLFQRIKSSAIIFTNCRMAIIHFCHITHLIPCNVKNLSSQYPYSQRIVEL